jgi:hypothetical protein
VEDTANEKSLLELLTPSLHLVTSNQSFAIGRLIHVNISACCITLVNACWGKCICTGSYTPSGIDIVFICRSSLVIYVSLK